MATSTYVIAIGSNRPGRHGAPRREVAAAIAVLDGVVAVAPTIVTAPLGPSHRRYANAAALVSSDLSPPAMLALLKSIERRFGRRAGRRWGGRVLDLDIVLWSEGCFAGQGLTVPHVAFRDRDFVLRPLSAIAPRWRDPVTGLRVAQLLHRLTRRPLPPRSRIGVGP